MEHVFFEGKWGDSEYGIFKCAVNNSVKVPRGEKAVPFMRDILRKFRSGRRSARTDFSGRHSSAKRIGEVPFNSGFAGYLTYEGEPNFVFVDGVERVARLASDISKAKPVAAPASNLTKNQYIKKLAQIKEYLYDGETYQVNFSQKFETEMSRLTGWREQSGAGQIIDPLALFEKLALLNPSPHQFFMETKDAAVISNSPERLLRCWRLPGRHAGDNGRMMASTKPIKGTVPRGKTPTQDRKNIARLLASEKDEAELAMIVDLERNDLGKICRPGTVKVVRQRAVEKYSHVIHTVSEIEGELMAGKDCFDALFALFPGGSVTGCPKIRSMEIIKKLEGEPRGVYCGSAGFIDLSGECDFNIMIRTIFVDKKRSLAVFRSGGGIVADSDPEKEYEETLHKAAAIIAALNG